MLRLITLILSLLMLDRPSLVAEGNGESLYLANCAECHQRDGRGIRNVYPALDANETVRGSGMNMALVMLIGRGEMLSFKGVLGNAEMAAIINYVRTAWSNDSEPLTRVSAEDIAKLQ